MIANQDNKMCLFCFHVGWRQISGFQNNNCFDNNEIKDIIANITEVVRAQQKY